MGSPGRAPDVAIIGAGIVGAATAAFLAEAGLSVWLIERAAIASGASGRNSGIVQQPFDPVLAALYRASVEEYRELVDHPRGPTFPAAPAGLLYVGRDEARAVRVAADWSATWPAAQPAVLTGAALTALEPALAPDLVACRLDIGFPVAPAAATAAFAERARAAGADVVIGREARVALDGGRAVGIQVGDAVEAAGAVVVAAGPRSSELIDPSGRWRPIRPVWGVVASVVVASAPHHGLEAIDIDIEPGGGDLDRAGDSPRDDLVDFSLVPGLGRGPGSGSRTQPAPSALGSTFLASEPDPAAWLDALRRVGSRYVPALGDAEVVGVRHCARPVSRDGRPLVGAVPGTDRLWIAAGHGPWGISTGPGTARLLSDHILRRIDDDGIAPELRVDRFATQGR